MIMCYIDSAEEADNLIERVFRNIRSIENQDI